MNMKYFRFLFGKANGCLVHFGELNDTLTEKRVTFLYLSETGRSGCKSESEGSLFLYPEYLDLVVLGELNSGIAEALKGILSQVKIGTLIVPKMDQDVVEKCSEADVCGEETYIWDEEILKQYLGEGMASVENVVSVGMQECSSYKSELCGWKFFVKCCDGRKLAMIHAAEEAEFEDCIMSVKQLHEARVCLKMNAPDLYGCAFRCRRYGDYQECRYREKDEKGSIRLGRTGTVLMNDAKELLDLFQESGIEETAIRFFGITGNVWENVCEMFSQTEKGQMLEHEYFIGSDSEVDDAAIGKVCRSGQHRLPVVLKDGKGICCSGFFKYKGID